MPEGRYRGSELTIEPDASAASYPLAMAAVAGGRVLVRGLHRSSAQGDAAFADLLARMGCTVVDDDDGLSVARDDDQPLVGVDVDMADVSDLVPTLAVVAAVATTPTMISGVGFIRAKESDRLGDLAGGALLTHHDHRLAMAFGVLGTVVEGVAVTDPGVVSKSWPDFWAVRDRILRST